MDWELPLPLLPFNQSDQMAFFFSLGLKGERRYVYLFLAMVKYKLRKSVYNDLAIFNNATIHNDNSFHYIYKTDTYKSGGTILL